MSTSFNCITCQPVMKEKWVLTSVLYRIFDEFESFAGRLMKFSRSCMYSFCSMNHALIRSKFSATFLPYAHLPYFPYSTSYFSIILLYSFFFFCSLTRMRIYFKFSAAPFFYLIICLGRTRKLSPLSQKGIPFVSFCLHSQVGSHCTVPPS